MLKFKSKRYVKSDLMTNFDDAFGKIDGIKEAFYNRLKYEGIEIAKDLTHDIDVRRIDGGEWRPVDSSFCIWLNSFVADDVRQHTKGYNTIDEYKEFFELLRDSDPNFLWAMMAILDWKDLQGIQHEYDKIKAREAQSEYRTA